MMIVDSTGSILQATQPGGFFVQRWYCAVRVANVGQGEAEQLKYDLFIAQCDDGFLQWLPVIHY